jgi:hypothetical protein
MLAKPEENIYVLPEDTLLGEAGGKRYVAVRGWREKIMYVTRRG